MLLKLKPSEFVVGDTVKLFDAPYGWARVDKADHAAQLVTYARPYMGNSLRAGVEVFTDSMQRTDTLDVERYEQLYTVVLTRMAEQVLELDVRAASPELARIEAEHLALGNNANWREGVEATPPRAYACKDAAGNLVAGWGE